MSSVTSKPLQDECRRDCNPLPFRSFTNNLDIPIEGTFVAPSLKIGEHFGIAHGSGSRGHRAVLVARGKDVASWNNSALSTKALLLRNTPIQPITPSSGGLLYKASCGLFYLDESGVPINLSSKGSGERFLTSVDSSVEISADTKLILSGDESTEISSVELIDLVAPRITICASGTTPIAQFTKTATIIGNNFSAMGKDFIIRSTNCGINADYFTGEFSTVQLDTVDMSVKAQKIDFQTGQSSIGLSNSMCRLTHGTNTVEINNKGIHIGGPIAGWVIPSSRGSPDDVLTATADGGSKWVTTPQFKFNGTGSLGTAQVKIPKGIYEVTVRVTGSSENNLIGGKTVWWVKNTELSMLSETHSTGITSTVSIVGDVCLISTSFPTAVSYSYLVTLVNID